MRKTRAEPRHKASVFAQKAARFAHAAATNAREEDWDPAVANAVNAVINLADALSVHYMGVRSASDSRFDALNLLASSDLPTEIKTPLRRHLEALLSVKGIAQYEGRLLGRVDAEKALSHMERAFQAAKSVQLGNG